jgi:hypothetical protein
MRYEIENKWALVYNDPSIIIGEFFPKNIIETESSTNIFDTESEMNDFIDENHLVWSPEPEPPMPPEPEI